MRHAALLVTTLLSVLSATAAAQTQSAPAPAAGPVVNPLTDMTVYPIAVWAQESSTAAEYAKMGVNIFVGEQGDPLGWCDELARSGCVGFVHWRGRTPEARQAVSRSRGFLGWMHGDEPDNPRVVDGEFRATGIPPEELIAVYKEMKASATPAPMYLNLGQGLAVGSNQTTPDRVYLEFMKCADIVCYDVYPVSTQDDGANRLHLVARGMSRLKKFAGDRPAWIWLECTRLSGDKSDVGNRAPTPYELRAEIWMSVLHGADGIGYFPHQFNPGIHNPRSIPEELKAEMTLTGGLLHKLAPILRTGRKSMLAVGAGKGRVDAAVWEKDGEVLVLAVNMRNEAAQATIQAPQTSKELTVLGRGRKARLSGKAISESFGPYEVVLYCTGLEPIAKYEHPAPAAAAEAQLKDVAIDFEGDLPKAVVIKGDAKVVEGNAHGGKKALALGEGSEVTIPITDKDFRGRVTVWVYDSSRKHEKGDELKPSIGPLWGLMDTDGRMMVFGILRRTFLSQASYSFAFTNTLTSIPSPGYAATDRTRPGWYKWEFDLTRPGELAVTVNGKATADLSRNYSAFDNGFSAIKLAGGGKGEPEEILIDDILVEYPKPRQEKPGKLADLPLFRDNRKGIFWSRTHSSRFAVPTLTEAPTIDGDLSDKGWVGAGELSTWTNTAGTTAPTYETKGVIGQFGGKLYMAFRCTEEFLDEIVTTKKAGWQNDCIEIFLDPGNRRTSYAHITITAGGRAEATRLVEDDWGEGRRDEDWKPRIEAKAGRAERAWTLEVAIDLNDLGDPAKNAVWAFDVARERKPALPENSVYTTGGFREAHYFGEMTLEPATLTLANGALTNRGDKEVTARVEVLISEREYGATFPAWEDMWFDLVRDTITCKVAPGEQVKLIGRDVSLKMPPGGRLRLSLLEPGPVQCEELIANVWGGPENK